jgi:siroheme synthase (precorrin-2 oxidase/ferrochelatase)
MQCKERGIPVNVCSDQKLCDFQFPSVIRDGEVVIGLNASGKDHSLVKASRQKLERLLAIPDEKKHYED